MMRLRLLVGLGLVCPALMALVAGCQSSGNDYESLLREYQKIADRAAALAQGKTPADEAVAKEVAGLAEKAAQVQHKMLMIPKQPTAEQRQRFDASSAKLQKAIHIACPKCPKG